MRRREQSLEWGLLISTAGLMFCALVGCRPLPPAPPTAPPPQQVDTPPPVSWADVIGGPAPHTELTAAEMQLLNARPCRCLHDGRLSLAARQHATDLIRSGANPTDGDLDRLRFLLLRQGSVDYIVEPRMLYPGTAEGIDVNGMAEQRLRWTHCGIGIGTAAEQTRTVWIGVQREVELQRIPTRHRAGTALLISGRALRGNVRLLPFVGLPSGAAVQLAPSVARADGRFAFTISLPTSGRYEVELLLDTAGGPRVVALFPLFVDVEPDPRPLVTPAIPPAVDSTPDIALFEFLNSARVRAGLPPLRRDRRLDRAASAHCTDMVDGAYFGHVSPRHGALDARLTAHRIRPQRSAENIARSSSALRIHRNLMGSPSHRIHMLDSRFTTIGIGTATDGTDIVATQIFASW